MVEPRSRTSLVIRRSVLTSPLRISKSSAESRALALSSARSTAFISTSMMGEALSTGAGEANRDTHPPTLAHKRVLKSFTSG